MDESRTHGLLELAHDLTDDEGDGEPQHDRLHRAVHEVTEQPAVVRLPVQATGATPRP